MDTVKKTAYDPNTDKEYKIELPADNLIEDALLQLEYPSGGLHKADIAEKLADFFSLSEDQKNAKYKNKTRIFNNYVGRVTAALIKSGKMVKTKSNRRAKNIEPIEEGILKIDVVGESSEKSIEDNYHLIREKLAVDLLQRIKDNSPAFFEELVIDLLVSMGYGGSREDAEAVGRSGDGGIDGIINEDRLGLDVVYVQAKRWDGNVGEPPIRDFAGALAGKGATKGIFITTSDFSNGARNYSAQGFKIVLIDGKQLAQLMIEHNIGVSIAKTYEIKRVDSDYFEET